MTSTCLFSTISNPCCTTGNVLKYPSVAIEYGETNSTKKVPLSFSALGVSSTEIRGFPAASLHAVRPAQDSVLSYWIVVQSSALSVHSDGGYAIRSAVSTESRSAGFTGNVHKSAKSEPEKSADRRLAQLPAEPMPPSTLENDWKSIQYEVPRLKLSSKFPSADLPTYSNDALNVRDSVEASNVTDSLCSSDVFCSSSFSISCQFTFTISTASHIGSVGGSV